MMNPQLLIAEDEPLLAQALLRQLQKRWPTAKLAPIAGNGQEALTQALACQPEVVFLDVQMPLMTGLETAAALVEEWPNTNVKPLPLIVFVTAYDQYAVEAFEHSAIDYLLKPLRPERLQQTINKLQARLQERANQEGQGQGLQSFQGLQDLQEALQKITQLRTTDTPPIKLQTIQASRHTREGMVIEMIPIVQVAYFEASEKYVRVVTQTHEYLIRTPIKDLLPQLDAKEFWQIHRATVVRVSQITQVLRDEAQKVWLKLKDRPERLLVSRLYSHLFRAM